MGRNVNETAIFKGMLHNIYGKQILNMDLVIKCTLVGAKIIPGDSSPLSPSPTSVSKRAEAT